MRAKKRVNLFYVLLVPVGAAFVVTAFAYGVMAFQAVSSASSRGAAAPSAHPLLAWLRVHGDSALLSELGVLAVLTVAAIVTDPWWDRRPTRPGPSGMAPGKSQER
jgi:hypothetical protein